MKEKLRMILDEAANPSVALFAIRLLISPLSACNYRTKGVPVAEKHTTSFDYFDLTVEVDDEGHVQVGLVALGDTPDRIAMDYDTFREVIDFVSVHGLKLKEPYIVEYADTREAIEA